MILYALGVAKSGVVALEEARLLPRQNRSAVQPEQRVIAEPAGAANCCWSGLIPIRDDTTVARAAQMSEAGGSRTDAPGVERGVRRAQAMLDEFIAAVSSAALSVADEERRRAADQIDCLAEAARSAARSLDGGNSARSARCAASTADNIGRFADSVRHRRWNDIIADVENFARREPRLFMLGAAALGYVAARAMLASPENGARPTAAGLGRQDKVVAAAVSSGSRDAGLAEPPAVSALHETR
jgi:hypothetical protein